MRKKARTTYFAGNTAIRPTKIVFHPWCPKSTITAVIPDTLPRHITNSRVNAHSGCMSLFVRGLQEQWVDS
jgi:hypothetical protein